MGSMLKKNMSCHNPSTLFPMAKEMSSNYAIYLYRRSAYEARWESTKVSVASITTEIYPEAQAIHSLNSLCTHLIRIMTERTVPDNRIIRIAVNVQNRSKIHIQTTSFKLLANNTGQSKGKLAIVNFSYLLTGRCL